MGVKNTSIGQVLKVGALGFIAYQAYKRYASKEAPFAGFKAKDNDSKPMSKDDKLDLGLEDSFPASDPMPLSRTGTHSS